MIERPSRHTLIRNLWPAALVLFFLVGIASSSAQIHETKSPREKIIAVIPYDVPPTYFQNKKTGKPEGFAVDVMEAIAARAGMSIDYRFGRDWTEITAMVRRGEADVIPNLGITEERKKYLDFTVPVEVFNDYFFVRSKTNVNGWSPEKRAVGVLKGGTAFEYLITQSPWHLDLTTYDSLEQGLFDLLAGRIDALAGPEPTVIKLAQESGIENRIKVFGKPLTEIKRAIAVRKGDTALLEQLNRAIEGFVGHPEYRRIYLKWFGKPKPYWTAERILMASGFVVFVIVIVMAAWRHLSILRLNRELSHNIEERMRAEEAMRKSQERYKDLFDSTLDGVFQVNADGIFTLMNRSGAIIFGHEAPEELIGRPALDYWRDPRDRDAYRAELKIKKSLSAYPIGARKKNGEPIELESSSRIMEDEKGNFLGIEGILRDVTDRRHMEEQQRTLSLTDELTGLYNRRGFFTLAEHVLKMADRSKRGLFMLYADLDDFKLINDTHGHAEGDKALREIAHLLKKNYRNSDVIARMGGDEFAVIPVGFAGDDVDALNSRLQKRIDLHNAQTDRGYPLSVSFGMAYYDPANPCSIDALLIQGDALMYEQKKKKKHAAA